MTAGRPMLVDCDVHCAATRHHLAPYLPELWREHLGNTNFPEPVAVSTMYPDWNPVIRTPPAELTLERLQEEVLDGVSLAILQCYYGVEANTHPYLSAALATAVNRWLQEEWLDRDERLRGTAVVTPQYPHFAVEEIERIAADRRFVQVMLPARAAAGYGHQQYWPILRSSAQQGLAVAITFGGGAGIAPTPLNWLGSYYAEYNTAILNFQSHVLSLVMSGIFAELPDLRIVVSEGGWTWLPPLMWRMDQEWRAVQREVPWVKEPPSAYVRRHFRFTTQPYDAPGDPRHLHQLLDQLGSDELLLYGSDYPHRYLHDNEELLGELGDELAERIRWRNACDWYALSDALTPEVTA
jgi:predicted TIM-barrel fold metal-dependent hydrolase